MGYGQGVLDDEINAYMLTEPESLASRLISRSNAKNIQQKLDRIFQKHFSFSMLQADSSLLIENLNQVLI